MRERERDSECDRDISMVQSGCYECTNHIRMHGDMRSLRECTHAASASKPVNMLKQVVLSSSLANAMFGGGFRAMCVNSAPMM